MKINLHERLCQACRKSRASGLWERTSKSGQLSLHEWCASCGMYEKLKACKPGDVTLRLVKSYTIENTYLQDYSDGITVLPGQW